MSSHARCLHVRARGGCVCGRVGRRVLDREEIDAGMAWLERYANQRSLPPSDQTDPWVCTRIGHEAKRLSKRILAACAKILDRDGDKSQCVYLVAAAGAATLGKHDIFALVSRDREDPLDGSGGVFPWDKQSLFEAMADPRAAPLIVDEWKAAIPRAEKHTHTSSAMSSWSSWRRSAARALAATGGPDEQAFLEAQASTTEDKHVKQACLTAAAAIAARNK